jgi:hypothetical protein
LRGVDEIFGEEGVCEDRFTEAECSTDGCSA